MPTTAHIHWVLLVGLTGVAADAGQAPGMQPGWNGQAERPPMGWRHWNAFGASIRAGLPSDGSNCSSPPKAGAAFQDDGAGQKCGSIARSIDLLTAKMWDVDGETGRQGDGKLASLAEFGYTSVGIDEGWEACGFGVNGSGHHNAAGNPLVNRWKFPDLKALTAYAHTAGLTAGWYLNGCACPDHLELEANYRGDVSAMHALGFDGAKFDGCGALRNASFYAELMIATGKNYSIENCHWGAGGSIGCIAGDDDSACPTQTWAPFNWFRTGGDLSANPDNWFDMLQNVVQFTQWDRPLSRQHAWAYPDMMQVGNIFDADGKLDVAMNRAHFGAWCICSSPLVLSLDLDGPAVPQIVPIVTNAEAIAVNQAWAGHPGLLLQSHDPQLQPRPAPPARRKVADPPPPPHSGPDGFGFVKYKGMLNARDDGGRPLRTATLRIAEAEAWCRSTPSCTCFTSETAGAAGTAHPVRFEAAPLLCASNGIRVRDGNPAWSTFIKADIAPAAAEDGTQQIWGKPLPKGAWALYLVNMGQSHPMASPVNLTSLLPGPAHFAAGATVRDVWAREPAPSLAPVGGMFRPPPVQPRDSAFYVLTPAP